MKSSKTKSGSLSNKPVYALIALYMPMTILTAFVFIVRELLSELIAFYVIFPIISGLISALAASFYCDFMKDLKTSRVAADIRGGVLAMFIAYLIASLISNIGNSMLRIIVPNLHNITSCLAALYAWDAVISLKQVFSARKIFDEYTEMYKGEQLQEALFGDSAVLQFNDEEIVKIRNNYLLQVILTSLILLLNTALDIPMPLGLYFLIILVFESVICFFGFLEIFRWEQYYAGEGLSLPPFDMPMRMIGIGLISIFCTIFAIIWSSDESLLKFRPVIDFFKWLFDLLRRTRAPSGEFDLNNIEIISSPPPIEQPVPDIGGERKGFPIWIWKSVQYTFIAIVVIGFLWFMISPLFNKFKGSKLTFRQRLKHIIKEWIRGVLNAFSAFIAFIRNDKTKHKLYKPNADEIRRAAENILGAYSYAKKKDMRRSATLFARLIIWGGEVRQVIWKPSHAPVEYCVLLAASVPAETPPPAVAGALDTTSAPKDLSPAIIRCGEIFEKALYSAEELSNEERKEFKELVEEIISSV